MKSLGDVPINLAPGESAHAQRVVTVPAGANFLGVEIELSGNCACGGNLIRDKRDASVWICERSHWWNRRKHARLKLAASAQILPQPKGEA